MNIEVAIYRQRIGIFGPGRGFKGHTTKHKRNHYVKGIHFCLVMLSIGIIIASLNVTSILINNCIAPFISITNQNLLSINNNLYLQVIDTVTMNNLFQDITMSANVHYSYSSRLLILSADIESNPGPISDKDEILNAISNSNKELRSDIKNLRSDISKIKSDINDVKQTCNILNSKMECLDSRQSELENSIKHVKSEMENIHVDRDMIMLDVDAIKELCDTKLKNINRIDSAVENIERNANKCRIRIFGLSNPDTQTSMKAFGLESFLKIARPDIQWDENCITNIYQVGKNLKPITFLEFSNYDFKRLLYPGRAALREKGIRFADVLTSRQMEMLEDLKSNGKSGYFVKGKLHVHESTPNRTFVTARRRLNETHVMHTDGSNI